MLISRAEGEKEKHGSVVKEPWNKMERKQEIKKRKHEKVRDNKRKKELRR